MLLLLSILISLILCNAQARLSGEGIIGGVPTKQHELKYQVFLQLMDMDWCGGSIIGEQHVLTAAHCVVDNEDQFVNDLTLKIIAGINDVKDLNNKDKVEVEVEKVYIPSFYTHKIKTSAGDIAVLKLKHKLNLGPKSNLEKVRLPPSTENQLTSSNSYAGSEALVSGFGYDQITLQPVETPDNKTKYLEDGSSSGKLLKAKALVVTNTLCQSLYKKYVIHDSQICAKVIQHPEKVHQGVCSGDSGSPLVTDGTQIGIVSYNYKGCNDNKRPAVYTRISAYITFINQVMNDLVTKDIRAQVWSIN